MIGEKWSNSRQESIFPKKSDYSFNQEIHRQSRELWSIWWDIRGKTWRRRQWMHFKNVLSLTRLRWSSWSAALKRLCSKASCPYRNNVRGIKMTFYITENKHQHRPPVGIKPLSGGSNAVTLCLLSHKRLISIRAWHNLWTARHTMLLHFLKLTFNLFLVKYTRIF